MKSTTLDKYSWRAIFVGLVVGAFGLSLLESSQPIGWTLSTIGGALIVAGIVMIGIRSTKPD